MKSKKELRNIFKEKLINLSDEYKEISSRKIFNKIINSKEYKQAKVIFVYVSMNDEVDTRKLIKYALNDNKIVAVPICISKTLMQARKIQNLDELKVGFGGILEPIDSKEIIRKEDIDFSIIPCISATLEGYRLGYGGGYYDRYFSDGGNGAILCRKKMLSKNLPIDDWDIKFNIFTEDTQ